MSQKSKKIYVQVVGHPDGVTRYSLAHARRSVRQGVAEWQGADLHVLGIEERLRRAIGRPSVVLMRAAGIPAVEAREAKPWRVLWPAKLTIMERTRQALGSLGDDPTEFRSFARYPDARTIAEMRRAG